MAYPKPLSQKTIERKLKDWDSKKVDELHAYYAALSNFYGVIMLNEAWSILRVYKPGFHKREFYEFSDIARREEVPYYVYELTELFDNDEEENVVKNRLIVNKALVTFGYGKFWKVYAVNDGRDRIDQPYVPKDLLKYKDINPIEENTAFSKLKKLINSIKTVDGNELSNYIFINTSEQFNIDYHKAEHMKRRLMANYSRPCAEKLLEYVKKEILVGNFRMQWFFNELDKVDAELSEKQFNKIASLCMEINNNSNLWVNFGWKPSDLSKQRGRSGIESMSFGPGLMKLIEDGDISKQELLDRLNKLGIRYEE